MDPFLGEIRLFGGTFAPAGWNFCDGTLLSIAENDALYSLISTTYGGDGISNFAVPDLRGRVPVHMGADHVLGAVTIDQPGTRLVEIGAVIALPFGTAADEVLDAEDRIAAAFLGEALADGGERLGGLAGP